mmetsp:Transcript_70183/g.210962  ORF Transcript_70183/g.210962 Transcript_70183/m.210962 type:complete len:248 (-) Transcript_70183:758-1501(-)
MVVTWRCGCLLAICPGKSTCPDSGIMTAAAIGSSASSSSPTFARTRTRRRLRRARTGMYTTRTMSSDWRIASMTTMCRGTTKLPTCSAVWAKAFASIQIPSTRAHWVAAVGAIQSSLNSTPSKSHKRSTELSAAHAAGSGLLMKMRLATRATDGWRTRCSSLPHLRHCLRPLPRNHHRHHLHRSHPRHLLRRRRRRRHHPRRRCLHRRSIPHHHQERRHHLRHSRYRHHHYRRLQHRHRRSHRRHCS